MTALSASASETSSDDKGPSRAEIEYANTNRSLAIGIAGTCIAILTFLLLFFYTDALAGEFDSLLFQLSLSAITISMFLMFYSATYYFRVALPRRKKDMKVSHHLRRADTLFFFGIMFLAVELPLILLKIRLYDVAAIAVALWLASVVLVVYVWRDFR